jgi:ADP-ribosylglycohydrolase
METAQQMQSCFSEAGNLKTDGNGALMRNGVTFLVKDLEKAMVAARDQALTTHKGVNSMLCCMLHTFLGWNFVNQNEQG